VSPRTFNFEPSACGRSPPIMVSTCVGKIRCNRWAERMQVTGQVECKRVVNWSAISHKLNKNDLSSAFLNSNNITWQHRALTVLMRATGRSFVELVVEK
jgi:hypothetical protein